MEAPQLSHDGEGHRRTKTEFKASVLRTFMHKRSPSDGTTLSPLKTEIITTTTTTTVTTPITPTYPHGNDGVLSELHHNHQGPPSPTKSLDFRLPQMGGGKSLHRKGLSTISLKQLAGRDNDKEDKPKKPKKSKSSTNLANILSRPKGSKSPQKAADEEARAAKDKENRTPLITSFPAEQYAPPPPIYAQFSRQSFTTQPSGGKFLEDEVQVYTPDEYSPSKLGYFDLSPSESNKGTPKPRTPSTTWLPSGLSVKDIEKRRVSRDMRNSSEIDSIRTSADTRGRESSTETRPSLDRKITSMSEKTNSTLAQRGARAFQSVWSQKKETELVVEVEKPKPFSINPKDIDTELEAMLDRRNIPENSRHKMRSLAQEMKVELIKQDWAEIAAAKNNASVSTNSSRPGTGSSEESAENDEVPQEKNEKKKGRPLSMTFSLKKDKDTPSSPKKSKSDGTFGRHKRTKSSDSTASAKSFVSTGSGVASTLIAKAKGQLPDDFVAYLRKVQKPELVEVGKLHKLRLLLRNEMVAWTDTFITLGGMAEIIALLHRIMAVEWREEHEDNLLHESLLCLKALCTTALAQQNLSTIQPTLFPALLTMLFSTEKKGPAEFTTRNIITDLLFTYLKSAPLPSRPDRARTLLSYLRDPQKEEDERPIGFVLEMRRERPYKVWCKEVVDVTKEVFWIFLHGLNVIAVPSVSDIATAEANLHTAALAITSSHPELTLSTVLQKYSYMLTHFPTDRPPVAAAPYVGGVEWDATNYLSSHLDLLNGIIASLPSREERNALREELRLSGWEKVMGATMRTCKEKFYGGVHCGLRCWIGAGAADGWDVKDVRQGPASQGQGRSPPKSPVKGREERAGAGMQKVVQAPPMLEIPGLERGKKDGGVGGGGEGWL